MMGRYLCLHQNVDFNFHFKNTYKNVNYYYKYKIGIFLYGKNLRTRCSEVRIVTETCNKVCIKQSVDSNKLSRINCRNA